MSKDSLIAKITRRFKRPKIEELPSDTRHIVVETVKELIEDSSKLAPKKYVKLNYVKYLFSSSGREYEHVVYEENVKILFSGLYTKKDPITRKTQRVNPGERTSIYYDTRGKLIH